jgi:MSHA biogenesis protein MshE
MGTQGYLIAAALDGVLAQRLLRRLCDNCAHPAELGVHHQAWLSRYLTAEEIASTKFADGMGCTYCNMTGYRGRVGVYELLEVDADIADAIRRTDLVALDRIVTQLPGFIPLVQRALRFAIDRVTSVDEVMRSMSGLKISSVAEPARRRCTAKPRWWCRHSPAQRSRANACPRSATTAEPRAARP